MGLQDDFFSGNLSEQNVILSKTKRYSSYGKDFILLDNPAYQYHNFEPYKLDKVAVIYCRKGTAEGSVNLIPYQCKAGGMLVVLSDHIVESNYVSEDFEGTHVFMSSGFLNRLNIGDSYKFYDVVERNPYVQLDQRACSTIENYFDMCHGILEYKDLNPNTEEALRLLTKLLFLMMGWFIHQDAYKQSVTDRGSEIVLEFMDLVKKNYAEHRDVQFYSDKMNMTAKYLSAVIKKTSGKTPLEWIENYVILDAKAQLSSTRNTVQQISYNLRFPSQSFFGRYFKRVTGVSPSEYRASARIHGKALSEAPSQAD